MEKDLSSRKKGNIYGLLTKREVNMAGYWPSYFWGGVYLWTETKSRSITM